MAPSPLVGIEIGATKLQLVLGERDGTIRERERRVVVLADGAKGIRGQISATLAEWRKRTTFDAVGVGFGGPVDTDTGRISRSCHVAGWNGFALGEWLGELTDAPVVVENDTNAAALAEAVQSAGRGANPVFYTNSGSGVGGGLVVGGQIYRGAKPGEAEFGHVRLDKAGTTVEDRCSGWALDRRVRGAAEAGDSHLRELIRGRKGGEARQLSAALTLGSLAAARIIKEAADDLAFALSHVVHLFHPSVVVLGGGVALIGEPWRAAVAQALPRYVMAAFAPGPDVRLTGLGEDAVPVGALLSAAALTGSTMPLNEH